MTRVCIFLLLLLSCNLIGARILFRGHGDSNEMISKASTNSIGMCCSSCSSNIPSGTPTMESVWWSNNLSDGAKVQIRANTWSTWWTPADGKNWNSVIKAYNQTAPPASDYFTVIRVDSNRIKLKTPDGRYVRAGSAYPPTSYGQMDTTTNSNDPGIVFTVERNGTNSVFFKCYDGSYVSSTGEYLPHWQSKPDAWERFGIREVQVIPAIRGVNLGSWLAFEKWMAPNLYPKPAVWKDGTAVQFLSMSTGQWITSENSKNKLSLASDYSFENLNFTFNIRRTMPNAGKFQFVSDNLKFWTMANGGGISIYSTLDNPGTNGYENFDIVFNPQNSSLALLLAPNGNYVQATSAGELRADVPKTSLNLASKSTWNGPCAFNITVVYSTDGEWQLSNTLGLKLAYETLHKHHASFITEPDWAYMKKERVNTVRIPIGYWLTQDPKPDSPFVVGYSKYLDWAFAMGAKYGIRIWISLHGLPGSQSGWSNTGTRDGTVRFPTDNNPSKAIDVVRWVAQRYGKNPSWLGIGLMNEGTTEIPLDVLQTYYLAAYEVVRTYSPCAYVSLEERIGSNPWTDVFWLTLNNYHTNTMIETHSYEVFGGIDASTTEEEINFMKISQLQNILGLQSYGQKLLVGEFSNAMKFPGSASQNLKFFESQIKTMGRANMGWFFWSLKLARNDYDGWSWYKSSAKGWLPRKSDGNWW